MHLWEAQMVVTANSLRISYYEVPLKEENNYHQIYNGLSHVLVPVFL